MQENFRMPMSRTKLSVLLVDDDGIYQFTARKTLEATGFADKIFICSNGEEALSLIQNTLNSEDTPDVIFLDVNMPVMNGWEFLHAYENIKTAINKSIAIYIVSSSVDEADIIHSKEFDSVKDYIIKPILKEKFTEILSSISA